MSQWTRPEPEYKLSEESAAAQIAPLIELYDLDVKPLTSKGEPNSILDNLDKLALQVRLGRLEISPDGTIKQTLADPIPATEITYKRIKGKQIIAADGLSENNYRTKVVAMLAAAADQPTEVFSALSKRDFDVAFVLGAIFLS